MLRCLPLSLRTAGGVIELKAGALREIKSKTSHRFPRPHRRQCQGNRVQAVGKDCAARKVAAVICKWFLPRAASTPAAEHTSALSAAPYRPSRRGFQRQTDKRTTQAPASGQTCAHFLILHLTCQLSRAPNQQKVAKDAPPKSRQPGENYRCRARARPLAGACQG